MALKFGTSGVRGLVTEMTDQACYLYSMAFVRYLKTRTPAKAVALSGDLRKSTPRIMRAVGYAIRQEGLDVDFCGALPTPAVTYYAMQKEMASIMVTGSHIPDDRNGIKFNMPWGEVLKEDEREISNLYALLKKEQEEGKNQGVHAFSGQGDLKPECVPEMGPPNPAARKTYLSRYTSFFPKGCFNGLKIVFYQHSSVARDLIPEMLCALGAECTPVGWSEAFVPVDTEAVTDEEKLSAWVRQARADALATTDGDGDRPLVVDETGKVVRGDVLGILVADFLQSDSVSLPVSCNTALEKWNRFKNVFRTRIGSPYVVASMMASVRSGHETVVGYEANGGFLTATDIVSPDTGALLKALPTRDAALPVLALLFHAAKQNKPVSSLVSSLPPRFTHSGLLRNFPSEKGNRLVEEFREGGPEKVNRLFEKTFGTVETLDFTDGARMTFRSGDVVHFRPSGNAPEFRCYTESSSESSAMEINDLALRLLREIDP